MIYITLLNPISLFVSRCNVHFFNKIVILRNKIYINEYKNEKIRCSLACNKN